MRFNFEITTLGSAMAALALAHLPLPAQALQPDGPFTMHQERNKAAWASEDTAINTKLAALEQKFGKKPNIIFILTDDIGWGEPGWQYGGKRRGTDIADAGARPDVMKFKTQSPQRTPVHAR